MEDDRWWSVFGRLAAPTFFFLRGLRADPDRPASLDLDRRHSDFARKLERRLDLGGTEHSFESRTHPPCTSLCADACATSRLGCLRPPRLHTSCGAADSGEDCRLRRGGMAVGPVRLMPAPIRRRHIRRRQRRRNSTLVSIRAGCDPDRRPDAASGLLGRCGRLRLAGTRGVLVSGNSFSRLYSGPRRSVRQPVSIQAWREPHPTAREK